MSPSGRRWEAHGRCYAATELSDVVTVLSAWVDSDDRPPDEVLIPFTETAVWDLLAAVQVQDPVGWIARNVAGALRLAGETVVAWRGVELALDHDDLTAESVWSEPDAARVQLLGLVLVLSSGSAVPVSTYQNDDLFGLWFVDGATDSADTPSPGYRTRDDLALPVGRVERVAVSVESRARSALVADLRLTIAGKTCALVAGEYVDGVWRRLDESVVAVPDAAALDRLDWSPPMGGGDE